MRLVVPTPDAGRQGGAATSPEAYGREIGTIGDGASMDRVMPNFLVIGAPKAGTTSLCYYLSQHPDIFISEPKELHYFCDDKLYQRGGAWYAEQFEAGRASRWRGEGTPFYAMSRTFPQVLPRLTRDLPDLRLIYMVRHPLERMESYFSQEINNGWRIPAFCEAVRTRPHYVDASLYNEQYRLYEQAYGKHNIHVIFFEDFRANPRQALDGAMTFLGVDSSAWGGDISRQNSRSDHLEDTACMRVIRQLPGFRVIERHRAMIMPQRVRSAIKHALRRSPKQQPAWDAKTMRWAVDQVCSDSTGFLQSMNKPVNYWGDLSRPYDT
jgi:hypothetical protein